MKTFPPRLGRLLGYHGRRQRPPELGGRELEVMKILWRGDAISAQQVLQSSRDNTLSLSTIQSTLERLYRKELIVREKSGRCYFYRAAISRSAIISQLLGDMAEQISDGDMAPMISGFMTFIEQETSEEFRAKMRESAQQTPPGMDSDE